jgi:GNAT superfamily N-acetyltransferase
MREESASDVQVPYPQYHCPVCGKELPLTEARLTITCSEHTTREPLDFEVREAAPGDVGDIEEICDKAWGETDIDCFGGTFDVLAGDNLVAVSDGRLLGLVSLAVDGGEMAVVLLTVYPEFQGRDVGTRLVEAAAGRARALGLPFVKATTSNDDIPMLYFLLRLGFVIYEVDTGSVADNLGSAHPGFAQIPMRDEVRLRRPVCA